MSAPAGGGILAKSGLDSIKVGGHKIPIALLAGIVAVIGVILLMRARSQGATVGSVGQAPATAAGSGFGVQGFTPDTSGALANISQQLTSLSQQQSTAGAAPPTGLTESAPVGFPTSGYGTIPLYLNPGGTRWSAQDTTAGGNLAAWLPWNSPIRITGAPVQAGGQSWEPVTYGGINGFAPVGAFQSFSGI